MSKKTKKTSKKIKEKKQKRNKDISIVQDVKEPFSWYRFWDEKILGTYHEFKRYLDKKGILYLLMSPFRYRARLIFRLWLIVICIMVGVVPRVAGLVHDAREQYKSNEFVLIKDQIFDSTNFTVTPLASSHKDNKHIMVFNIRGSSSSGVSSKTDDYDVRLTANREVSKPTEITYRYQIRPFDANQRLLIVELDLTHTSNTGGIYDLWVNAKGVNGMKKPLQLTISKQQIEAPIYDGDVHLSALSTLLSPTGVNKNIENAERVLVNTLRTYKLEYDRLEELGTKVEVTPEQISQFAEKSLTMNGITDASTTDQVSDAPPKTLAAVVAPTNAIKVNGKRITASDYTSNGETLKTIDTRVKNDMASVVENTNKVVSAINAVNQARLQKYTVLYDLARTLSSEFKDSAYTEPVTIADTKSPLTESSQ